MNLIINGTLALSFFELKGNNIPVSIERKKEIETKLISGEYLIGLASGVVSELPNLETVATFRIEVLDDTEYSFEESESD